MCAHGGTSDPLSRWIIRRKCLFGPCKAYKSQSRLGARNDNTSLTSSLGERKMQLGTIQGACK